MCNCCKCLSPVKIIDLATLLPFSLSHTQYKWPHISMQKKMVETIKAKDLFFLSPLGTLSLGRLVPATPWLRAPAARRVGVLVHSVVRRRRPHVQYVVMIPVSCSRTLKAASSFSTLWGQDLMPSCRWSHEKRKIYAANNSDMSWLCSCRSQRRRRTVLKIAPREEERDKDP